MEGITLFSGIQGCFDFYRFRLSTTLTFENMAFYHNWIINPSMHASGSFVTHLSLVGRRVYLSVDLLAWNVCCWFWRETYRHYFRSRDYVGNAWARSALQCSVHQTTATYSWNMTSACERGWLILVKDFVEKGGKKRNEIKTKRQRQSGNCHSPITDVDYNAHVQNKHQYSI